MKISLLQWNIWYQEDIEQVARFLKAHPTDVVCLQELTIDSPDQSVKDTPAFIAEQLGYDYYAKELPIESTDGKKMMLANGIFSRFPIIDKRFVWINQPKKSGGYSDEYRAYVEVMLDVKGTNLSVGTVHMSYTHRFEPTESKAAETDKLLAELGKHPDKFVFTGDLNAVPGSHTINSINKILCQAGPDLTQKTWTTKPFSYNGFKETDLNWRLDYVFTTKDIRVASSTILTTDYSDHLPIFAELTI